MINMAKPKSKVRVGIFGCGGIANLHVENLLKIEGVQIVALYNRGRERLERMGKKVPRARLYQDALSMVAKEKMDAAIISLTPDCHGELELALAKNKVAMFIEKPIGLSEKVTKEIADEVNKNNVITSVAYQERYNPVLDLVKEMVKREPAGLVNAYWIGSMPSPEWWRTKASSGGQAVEQTTHLADMMRYIFGEAESVYAYGKRNENFLGAEHDVEDYSSALIRMRNGIALNLLSGCYTGAEAKVGFEIITTNHRIEYAWNNSLRIISSGKTEELNIRHDGYMTEIKTFIDAVKTGDRFQIRSNYDDALESLKLTLAVNRSMETNEVVKL